LFSPWVSNPATWFYQHVVFHHPYTNVSSWRMLLEFPAGGDFFLPEADPAGCPGALRVGESCHTVNNRSDHLDHPFPGPRVRHGRQLVHSLFQALLCLPHLAPSHTLSVLPRALHPLRSRRPRHVVPCSRAVA
jgi:hypothetical protein